MTILTAIFTLFLVMNPVGNAIASIALLRNVPGRRRIFVLVRESLVAMAVLLVFLFSGRYLLSVLQIEEPVLSIAGGVVLFLIAIKMVFQSSEGMFGATGSEEPLIVPLAVPMLAGPSSIAVVLLLASRDPDRMADWFVAVVSVCLLGIPILIAGDRIGRLIGRRGALAVEKLMGILLTVLSIQLFLTGVEAYLRHRLAV
jgi:small neutral amino acid transporter SnatA (MarC family)